MGDLCSTHGVQGFPTIKYGDPSNLEDYQGGRDFDSLKSFADENLKPMCSPSNIDLCDDEQRGKIEALQAMSAEELDALIQKGDDDIAAAGENFETSLKELQNQYEALVKEKEDAIQAVKDSGLGMAKAVKAASA